MVKATGPHLFPSRTEKLSPSAPMVLRKRESRSPPFFVPANGKYHGRDFLCFPVGLSYKPDRRLKAIKARKGICSLNIIEYSILTDYIFIVEKTGKYLRVKIIYVYLHPLLKRATFIVIQDKSLIIKT